MPQGRPRARQLLLFIIEDNHFCCPTSQVMSLLAPPHLIRTPFMPEFARGAFDYQGHTASVISLRHKLHFGHEDRADGVVLLSRIEGRVAGFWVDAVDEVVETEQVKWLTMPEGLQDEVFSHAIQYENRTAFYIDLHELWQRQQQTLLAVQQIDPQQLEVLVETEPEATPVMDTPSEGPSTTELAVDTQVADESVVAIEVPPEPEPEPEPVEVTEPIKAPEAGFTEEAEDPANDYRVASTDITIDTHIEQREDWTPIVATLDDNNLRLPPRKPSRQRYWPWLLLLLLLLSGLSFLYIRPQRESMATAPASKSNPIQKPVAPVASEEHVVITVQKKPLENPPPHVVQHIVVKGDTLWDISSAYLNNPWRYPELARKSRIKNPDRIYPGDVVIIYRQPKPSASQ